MCPDRPCELPHPDKRAKARVVIYDGGCGLCRATAGWLSRLDQHGRLAFLRLEDPRVAERYADLSPEQLEKHVYVIDACGRR